jgi:hypothetical protein
MRVDGRALSFPFLLDTQRTKFTLPVMMSILARRPLATRS